MTDILAPAGARPALTHAPTRSRRGALALSLLSCLLVAAAPVTAQSTAAADTVSARTDLPVLRQADASRTRGAAPGGAIDTTRPTLHEFVDYACPSCREFTTTRGDSLRTLASTLRFNLIYHVSPIPRLLRGPRAAEAAFCAGGLGGAAAYDRMHEHLFDSQDAWRTLADGSRGFVEAARTASVDTAAFRRCLTIGITAPLIAADLRLAGLLAVEGTPTFIVSPPGRSDLGTRIVGDASMLRIAQAVRDAERADDPEPNAGALLGRWVVDSIETFAWRATIAYDPPDSTRFLRDSRTNYYDYGSAARIDRLGTEALRFETPPLRTALALAGRARLAVTAHGNVGSADLAMDLYAVRPDGSTIWLTGDMQRVTFVGDTARRIDFESLNGFERSVRRGDRLRLVVTTPHLAIFAPNFSGDGAIDAQRRSAARPVRIQLRHERDAPALLTLPIAHP
jgi:protein-disulfide isomerase